ncbi:Uncharacterised protein [BD1-7 clade bacterium]|uniref:Cytochrome C biogenesis protein transmembrane domain-containing protein n=1 Tax=BD1-7 clade bacterium TaxID=2029982 RepID=A0A5S9QVJ5_9GAMM|nr:Uncharacterised protein [BD1-7 clade bacterium]CAA0122524.1 Uncharacterised protein [BD1-7 clade bacterium]
MEFSAIPLAFFAGAVGLLSPCVLPMVPVVTASAMRSSKAGLLFLALGISLAFAVSGTLLTYLLLNAGISPDVLREISAGLMIFMGLVLVIPKATDAMSHALARLQTFLPAPNANQQSAAGQFIVGCSLGFVWLPCVGPTIGSAIALASTGQQMGMAFFVMLSFGIGSALPLIVIGYLITLPAEKLAIGGKIGKWVLALALIALGITILTGVDRMLEAWAMHILPDWIFEY